MKPGEQIGKTVVPQWFPDPKVTRVRIDELQARHDGCRETLSMLARSPTAPMRSQLAFRLAHLLHQTYLIGASMGLDMDYALEKVRTGQPLDSLRGEEVVDGTAEDD